MRRWGPAREGLGSLEGKLGGGAGRTGVPQPPSSRAGEGGPRCLIALPLIHRPPPRSGRSPVKGTGKGLQDTLAVPHSRLRVARCLG